MQVLVEFQSLVVQGQKSFKNHIEFCKKDTIKKVTKLVTKSFKNHIEYKVLKLVTKFKVESGRKKNNGIIKHKDYKNQVRHNLIIHVLNNTIMDTLQNQKHI